MPIAVTANAGASTEESQRVLPGFRCAQKLNGNAAREVPKINCGAEMYSCYIFAMISNLEIATRLEAIEADITTLGVDAIVNAANAPLLPGGGVGAIRHAAGFEIDEDLERIGRCEPGSSVLTFGYRLPASYVIHTVAPVWPGQENDEREKQIFSECYSSALKLADENEIFSIGFPSIGTGAYHWPVQLGAELAVDAVIRHLCSGGRQTRVIFCCFAADDHERYAALLSALPR